MLLMLKKECACMRKDASGNTKSRGEMKRCSMLLQLKFCIRTKRNTKRNLFKVCVCGLYHDT